MTGTMTGKICMVTGATSGIGAATALALAQQGATVVVVGRNKKKCINKVNKIENITHSSSVDYMLADLSSLKEIHRLSDKFKHRYKHLDVLVNNVGARCLSRQQTIDGYEMSFGLNYLGHFLLTNLLLESLETSVSARIINVSSSVHEGCSVINFDDLHSKEEYDGKKAYAQSKLANILFTYELARRLKGKSITVNAVHPGNVLTNFSKNNGWISWAKHMIAHLLEGNLVRSSEGAETIFYLATSPDVEGISGKYFANCQSISSSDSSYDMDAASRLWQMSHELTGLYESSRKSKI